MASMNRVRMAVLFLVAAVLLAGKPALAGGTSHCKLAPTGIEPNASGQATLAKSSVVLYVVCHGELSVSCRGLKPDATYYFWTVAPLYDGGFWWGEWPFIANAKGVGKAGGGATYYWTPFAVGVTNANGDNVLTGEVQ